MAMQGGGTAARAAAAVAESLRITPNPTLAVHPMFVRPAPKADRASSGKRPGPPTPPHDSNCLSKHAASRQMPALVYLHAIRQRVPSMARVRGIPKLPVYW